MWRVQKLDQINAFNPANLFDFKSLALKIRKKQIGWFKTVTRQVESGQSNFRTTSDLPARPCRGLMYKPFTSSPAQPA